MTVVVTSGALLEFTGGILHRWCFLTAISSFRKYADKVTLYVRASEETLEFFLEEVDDFCRVLCMQMAALGVESNTS